MESGSQEAEGHKSMGGGRTWYGKWEAVIPCPSPPFNNDISAQRSVTCNDQCDTLDWALHVTCLFLTHYGIIYDTLLKMGWQLGI